MKHSKTNIATYRRAMEETASARREAQGLAEFLEDLRPGAGAADAALVLLQGHSPNGLAHKAVKALKGLSVASPYCATALGFDVVFRGAPGALAMYVSDGTVSRLHRNIRERLAASTTISERRFWLVTDTGDVAEDQAVIGEDWHSAPLPFQIATYGHTMARIPEMITAAFGPCRVLISENSQLPFSAEL